MIKKNVSKIILSFIIGALIMVFFPSCSTDSGEKEKISLLGMWKQEGLGGLEINNINEKSEPILISTTNGVFSKDDQGFTEFGLQGKPLVKIIQMNEKEYLAAIETIHFESGEITLYKTTDNGENWFVYMGNYGGDDNKYTIINDLIVQGVNNNVLFACGSGNVAKTVDGGIHWNSIYLTWEHLGSCEFVRISSHNPNTIWAGGSNAIFAPSLLRSDDGGDNWKYLTVLENVETTIHDIIIHHEKLNQVMVGFGGGIRKSIDNGESWETVFDEAGIYTFTNSAYNSWVVYASGINPQRTLFFAASSDFGDSWEIIEWEEGPAGIRVNDMVSVMEDGKEVLYFATNKGVYSYTFGE